MTARTASTRSAGPAIQPIFHPVVENVLPPDEIVSVRSHAPGSVASGHVARVEDEVLVHLVGDDHCVVLLGQADDLVLHFSGGTPRPSGCAGR